MDVIRLYIQRYIDVLSIPKIGWTDILEIIIISILIYEILLWVRKTRAWALFKGLSILLLFILFALAFHLNTILWIASKTISVGIIAVIILFQPELRRALEQLGRNGLFTSFSFFDDGSKTEETQYTDRAITEIIHATYEMAKAKTGALIVLEQKVPLGEYEHTGIAIDAEISSELLINIFEKNTPLHDGAVLIRPNRVVAATCYLPISNNMGIAKELGTRHRAAIGLSEVSDSITIIVSEETGKVSLAVDNEIYRNIEAATIRNCILDRQKKSMSKKNLIWWKAKNENKRN